MKIWENRAFALLTKSLDPIPSEMNELDWKSELSDKSDNESVVGRTLEWRDTLSIDSVKSGNVLKK